MTGNGERIAPDKRDKFLTGAEAMSFDGERIGHSGVWRFITMEK